MMAARFRSVTWVAIALVPALGCYLVTQHVAAERAQLAKVERQIGQSRKAIRDLETELGTRGSMAQLERWNTQTLALAAPTAQQYVEGDVRLASLTTVPITARPAIVTAALTAPAPATVAPAEVRVAGYQAPAKAAAAPAAAPARPAPPAARPAIHMASYHAPITAPVMRAEVKQAAFRPVKAVVAAADDDAQPLLRQATYQKPPRDQVRQATTKVAMLSGGPLDSHTLADIGRIARSERGNRRP